MRIGVPRECTAGERRVALIPETVGRMVKAGHEVILERDAGTEAGFPDAQYVAAGGRSGSADEALAAELVFKVQPPADDEVGRLRRDSVLVAFLAPATSGPLLERLAAQGVSAFSMELVPRITRAQSMDALSSQATIAGYKAVLIGASAMSRILPMLTTAAGTLPPARAFVIGAGVAGLQAIATARRLGAIVSAFDVRPVVKEQVQSLGASFVEVAEVAAEGQGGYARELATDQQQRVLDAIGGHIKDGTMRPGSAIVDLAGETGGNCELSRFGETVDAGGVAILAPSNLPATVPHHASQMYSRNLFTFFQHVVRDGKLVLDLADEITGAMCVTSGGAVRYGRS
jgi:proton-translocating NAD(P)+ transhydrogenase subunit alpha